MTQAIPYIRSTSFADDERDNVGGRSTARTAQVDAELDAIAVPLNQTIANLSLLQRDDGVMRDGVVPVTALGSDVLKLISAFGGTIRGAWVTATAYAVKDVVVQASNTYVCAAAHTSGTFATDLAAVRWILIQIGANPNAAAVAFSPTVNILSTNTQAAIVEVDAKNAALAASLVASNAAYGIGYLSTGTLVSPRTVGDKLGEQVSLLDYMNSAQRTAYRARTLAVDLYTPIQNAINEVQGSGVDLFATYGSALLSQALTVSAALRLRGAGRWKGTVFQVPGATTGMFTIGTDDAVEISDMFLQGHAAATAGRAISLSGGTMNAYSLFQRLILSGFWDQFYTVSALLWGVRDVEFNGAANYATHVENTYNADAGDSFMEAVTFANAPNSRAAIHFVSSGGLRVSNFKINTGRWGFLSENAGTTSDLILTNGSIENTSVAGIAFGHTAGTFKNVALANLQVSLTPDALLMNDSAPTYDIVRVSDFTMSGVTQYGALFENVGSLLIDTIQGVGPGPGPNFAGSIGLKIGSTVTNATVGERKLSGFEINLQNLSARGTLVKSTRPLFTFTSGASVPANNTLNTIATALCPAGSVDVDSVIRSTMVYAFQSGTSSRTLSVYLGSTATTPIWTRAFTTGSLVRVELMTGNVGVLNSQITTAVVTVDGAVVATTKVATTADFANDQPLLFTVQKTVGADDVVVSQVVVELLA